METRLEQVRSAIGALGLDALVVTKTQNVRYLSGFSGGSAVLVVTASSVKLLTDGRYRLQAAAEAPGLQTIIHSGRLTSAVADALAGAYRIGFESTASFDLHSSLSAELDNADGLVPTTDIVETIRLRKDDEEVRLINRALSCAAEAFSLVLPMVKPGVTERRLAAELDYRMMLAGADGPGFDTIVASGPNSAMPHAGLTDRALAYGDLVVIDFGAREDGYCSDVSRTLVVGSTSTRQESVIEGVRGAQRAAIAALENGAPASTADETARGFLDNIGLGECFTHGLGHGIGLEPHEGPRLAATSNDVLSPGMVFTIEPGFYEEGWGGVRIEDMVVMREDGPEVLSADIPPP